MIGWGIPLEEMEMIAKKHKVRIEDFGAKSINIGMLTAKNFEGDCGALYLNGANMCSQKDIAAVNEIASACGHSKIFATIVCGEGSAQLQKDKFLKEGWTVIKEGKSNRNPTKTDIVLFYYNSNCLKKGY